MSGFTEIQARLVKDKFIEKFRGYQIEVKEISSQLTFLIIEDSHIYAIERIEEIHSNSMALFSLYILELTFNQLEVKYIHSHFVREIQQLFPENEFLSVHLNYRSFPGFSRVYWNPDSPSELEWYDLNYPQLNLRNRYNQWDGICYKFIVMEFQGYLGNKEYLVAYTTRNPFNYINDFIKKSISGRGIYRAEDMRGNYSEVVSTFRTWKKMRILDRFEHYFKYFVIEEFKKEKSKVWKRADEILENAREDKFVEIERFSYSRPINKWKSEELLFRLVKSVFKSEKVIYQHRPYFLKSSKGGQLSYDIYIPSQKIAIEYQGKQHFEPIDFFGGQENYLRTIQRDKEKFTISQEHGIRLIYYNYWEEISRELLLKKISEGIPKKMP